MRKFLTGGTSDWIARVNGHAITNVDLERHLVEQEMMIQQLVYQFEQEYGPDAGRKIFKEFCATCHAEQPLIDIRAPRIGDKAIWSALSKQGFATLLKVTIEGRGAMPARGGCFECSDAQLTETIQYILKNSAQ